MIKHHVEGTVHSKDEEMGGTISEGKQKKQWVPVKQSNVKEGGMASTSNTKDGNGTIVGRQVVNVNQRISPPIRIITKK